MSTAVVGRHLLPTLSLVTVPAPIAEGRLECGVGMCGDLAQYFAG